MSGTSSKDRSVRRLRQFVFDKHSLLDGQQALNQAVGAAVLLPVREVINLHTHAHALVTGQVRPAAHVHVPGQMMLACRSHQRCERGSRGCRVPAQRGLTVRASLRPSSPPGGVSLLVEDSGDGLATVRPDSGRSSGLLPAPRLPALAPRLMRCCITILAAALEVGW